MFIVKLITYVVQQGRY